MNPRAVLRPIMRSVQTRVDNAVRAAEKRDERRLQVAVGELHEALATEAATQHRLRAELGERFDELNDQLRRISGQLVALEQRVGALERPAVELGADDAERRTARALVDEVRLEHDRTQAGLAAIAFYEERLARLEQAANPGVS
jgi:seryl-tRNA synthetase